MLPSLFDGDFDTYFAQAGQSTPLWLFVHVPKTAGSSLQADMARLLTPQTNIAIDYSDKSDTTYKARFEAAVDRFLAQHARVPYRFASGHLQACNTEIIRDAVPDLRAFTMLRDPILRLVSDYRYQRSGLNVAREDFIARTPDFAAYVARPYVHNKTAIALVPREMVTAGDAAGRGRLRDEKLLFCRFAGDVFKLLPGVDDADRPSPRGGRENPRQTRRARPTR